MNGRMAAMAALFLAGCVSTAPADDAARAPPPPVYDAAPEASPAPGGAVAAPGVSVAPAPAPAAQRRGGDNEIVVPAQREQQVQPPNGDPRTASERMADIRAWDQCVMQMQNASDGDPLRPQLDTPEATCGRQLGMADRMAVPVSRMRRQP